MRTPTRCAERDGAHGRDLVVYAGGQAIGGAGSSPHDWWPRPVACKLLDLSPSHPLIPAPTPIINKKPGPGHPGRRRHQRHQPRLHAEEVPRARQRRRDGAHRGGAQQADDGRAQRAAQGAGACMGCMHAYCAWRICLCARHMFCWVSETLQGEPVPAAPAAPTTIAKHPPTLVLSSPAGRVGQPGGALRRPRAALPLAPQVSGPVARRADEQPPQRLEAGCLLCRDVAAAPRRSSRRPPPLTRQTTSPPRRWDATPRVIAIVGVLQIGVTVFALQAPNMSKVIGSERGGMGSGGS
jgi:hypothetical protein